MFRLDRAGKLAFMPKGAFWRSPRLRFIICGITAVTGVFEILIGAVWGSDTINIFIGVWMLISAGAVSFAIASERCHPRAFACRCVPVSVRLQVLIASRQGIECGRVRRSYSNGIESAWGEAASGWTIMVLAGDCVRDVDADTGSCPRGAG
jgi:hypothetical protein